MPAAAKSTTEEPRQASVLWWVTQPRALYCTWAVRAPVTVRSLIMRNTGWKHSPRLVVSAGQ